MSLETNIFQFHEFVLDGKEKVLLKEGKQVQITPKAFQLLLIMVENAGILLEKSDLIESVWTDSFVEEGNLTFTIRLLRKILDDDSRNPRFIETVRKHGYRFVADVKKITTQTEDALLPQTEVSEFAEELPQPEISAQIHKTSEPSPETLQTPVKRNSTISLPLAATAGVLLLTLILAGGWYLQERKRSHLPILNTTYSSEKLSTSGNVFNAEISPDGKNVAYIKIDDKLQSLWIRQIETSNNILVIPPAAFVYGKIAFSPDGSQIYFARYPLERGGVFDIYRMPTAGGIAEKIIDKTQGWVDVSPDGTKISFVREPSSEHNFYSLWTADTRDGKNEKLIASRPTPNRISSNGFSPDGKYIAFAAGQSENQSEDFGLYIVNLETAEERETTPQKFFNIHDLDWLPDESGLLVSASKIPNRSFMIWQVSLSSGEISQAVKDSESYGDISLDNSAERLITTQIKENFYLKLFQKDDGSEDKYTEKTLGLALGAAFAPNGDLFYTSPTSNNPEIWNFNFSEGWQMQLTNNSADDLGPIVSPDSKTVFFVSNRTGKSQIWRMNTDGSNQTQITKEFGGYPLGVTSDGKWVYYLYNPTKTLWRVSTDDGTEEQVLEKGSNFYSVSPDASTVAVAIRKDKERFIQTISLINKQLVGSYKINNPNLSLGRIAWTPDGKAIGYTLTDENDNTSLWLQPTDQPTTHQIFDLGKEFHEGMDCLSFAPDNQSFAAIQGKWSHDAVLLRGLK